MAFDLHLFRLFLYIVLCVFSIVVLGLSAARLHYTTHLPPGDPLNQGRDFHDPIVAELLVTSLITIAWSIFAARVISFRAEFGLVSTFFGESAALSILFLFWIVGAGVATSMWGNLSFCHQFQACRLLTALVAFSWLGWIVVLFLVLTSALFAFVNRGFGEQMHGRWDPRASHYRDSQGVYASGPARA